jgi:putative ATP-binding cassette transporter
MATRAPSKPLDRQLWQKFIHLAQPYWFPHRRGSTALFLGLLLLLLIFLTSGLALGVIAISTAVYHWRPTQFEAIAPGLWSTLQQLGLPFVGVLGLGLIIPLMVFLVSSQRLRGRWLPWLLLSVLLLLSLTVNGLNVIISYVGRFFQTALADKDAPTFWRFLWVYASVFVVGTPIVVFYSYAQDKLGLHWRRWLTHQFLDRYFRDRAYYDIDRHPEVDNPDQRISEDVRSFTRTSLSFLLMVLDSLISLIAFTGILWSISHLLVGVLLVYATVGTLGTILLGRRLIRLNFNQLKQEANFRYGLVHVRDNAESIAFYQGEAEESATVQRRLGQALHNFNVLIGWQRNLGFFTTGYGYFVVIVPALVVAPRYFAGELDFGGISQASFAFTQVLGAVSIIVDQFESLSAFAAGVDRLDGFSTAMAQPLGQISDGHIQRRLSSEMVLDNLSLRVPGSSKTLIRQLSAQVPQGQGMLMMGPSGCGKSSLLRAIAGLWSEGEGSIAAPPTNQMMFLPQRPYMPLGSLRHQLLYPYRCGRLADEVLQAALEQVNLADLPERVGGWEAELDWVDVLSLGEQQRLAFARLLLTQPGYAILDEATSALDVDNEARLYQRLRDQGTTVISVGHRSSLERFHDALLVFDGAGQWQYRSLENASFQQILQPENGAASGSTVVAPVP